MIRAILFGLLAVGLGGCGEHAMPCEGLRDGEYGYRQSFMGFQYRHGTTAMSHCRPCEEAEQPEALFVCYGRTYTARAK